MERRAFPDDDVSVDDDVRMKRDARSDGGALGDRHKGAHVRGRIDRGLWVNRRGRVDAGRFDHLRVQNRRGLGVGNIGVLHHHQSLESESGIDERRVADDQDGRATGWK